MNTVTSGARRWRDIAPSARWGHLSGMTGVYNFCDSVYPPATPLPEPIYAIDVYLPMAYMSGMLVSVVETESYLSKARKVMSEAEMEAVVLVISESPMAGDVIQGTSGLRKLRVPLQGRGKRGGGRVVYWYYNEGYPAILLWVFAKNEASDLSPSQKKQLVSASELFTRQFRSVK